MASHRWIGLQGDGEPRSIIVLPGFAETTCVEKGRGRGRLTHFGQSVWPTCSKD
jgi:hypothetical protein